MTNDVRPEVSFACEVKNAEASAANDDTDSARQTLIIVIERVEQAAADDGEQPTSAGIADNTDDAINQVCADDLL